MKFLSFLFVLVFIISCSKNIEKTSFDKQKNLIEIRTMLLEYHKAVEKGGLLAEFDYLDDSSDFYWVPPGYTSAISYDSVKNILTQNAKTIASIRFKWDTLQIFPLSNSIGSFTGIVESILIDTSGTITNMSIIESGTVIKRKSGWKLLNGQSRVIND